MNSLLGPRSSRGAVLASPSIDIFVWRISLPGLMDDLANPNLRDPKEFGTFGGGEIFRKRISARWPRREHRETGRRHRS